MKKPQPRLDATTIDIYADNGPAQKVTGLWVRFLERWYGWHAESASGVAVVAGILGPQAVTDLCEALGVERYLILAFLHSIVDRGNQFHAEVRAEWLALFPTYQDAHDILVGSDISRRLESIPIVHESTRVYRLRKSRANARQQAAEKAPS